MSKIDVDDLKQQYDLRDLASGYVDLKRAGRAMVGCCPFHDDSHASFYVWNDHYHCFGCGASGDVVSWTMKRLGVDFKAAIGTLSSKTTKQETPAKPLSIPTVTLPDLTFPFVVGHRKAIKYFISRGLTEKTISRFKLGYDGWRFCIPTFAEGTLVHVARRRDPHNTADNRDKYMSAKGSKAAVFNGDAVADTSVGQIVYVAEGQIDAMLLCQAGLVAVSTTAGCSGFKREWLEMFRGKLVTVNYDSDAPGVVGGYMLASRLTSIAAEVRISNLMRGMMGAKDVGEYAVAVRRQLREIERPFTRSG